MRIIVGITGATGAVYAITLLGALRQAGIETHLVISRWGQKTLELECGIKAEQIKALVSAVYDEYAMDAKISSGSFKTDGMVIVPCSMKTLAFVSSAMDVNLVCRAASVTLKEHRKLVVVPRETPLSLPHLENMLKIVKAGAVVLPPMPAFYNSPQTIQDLVNHTVGRILDQFGIGTDLTKRWNGIEEGII